MSKAKEGSDRRPSLSGSSSGAEKLKIIVRRLPPHLPEDVFWQSVQQWVTNDTVTWKQYYPGKFRSRMNKENIPSRAYIAFKRSEQLAAFSRDYDGHLFRDKAGNESQAVVEFAPYQKVPLERKKPDARTGTIENDDDYNSFIQSLASPTNAEPVTMETLLASLQAPAAPTTTPLLEALKAEKSANKDKEAILRNHAHYKDPVAAGSLKKEDIKKKGVAPKPVDPLPPMSKKAAKKLAAVQKHQQQQQAAKAAASASASTTAPSKPANAHGTPKAPRAMREAAAARAKAAAPTTQPAAAAPTPVPTGSAVPSTSDATSTQGPPTQPRRSRPIIGAASRQFEAALSGAGVSSKERRPKRESDSKPPTDPPPTAGTPAAPPTSPRRNRRREEPKPANSGPKVPSILQREQETSSAAPSAPQILRPGDGNAEAPPSAGSPPARSRGRGGRGRGRSLPRGPMGRGTG